MNRRIALNACVTYFRTIVTTGFALFSSRWVLGELGQSDYGLYSIVGSVIVFITFLNNVMALSVSRHFAYAIGQNDFDELGQWFNTALGVHLVGALLLTTVGLPVGHYAITHILTIPAERLYTSIWVFRVSLVSAFAGMVSVPFMAMFTARQRMVEPAVWGMLQAVLVFSLAASLKIATGDRLQYYATGMVAIITCVTVFQIVRGWVLFAECRIESRKLFDFTRYRELFSFAAWNLVGYGGVLCRDQGSAILLNLFFGPMINAAYGVAGQVSLQTNHLAAALISAFSPEITASEGRGERTRVLELAEQASRLGTLFVLLLAIPLMADMEYLLTVWLRTPPPSTATLCRLMLATFVIDRLSTGYMLAVQAQGRIAAYQASVGLCLLLTLPLSWVLLKIGLPPTSIGWAFVATMSVTSLGRAVWGRRLFNIPMTQWFRVVVGPGIIVTLSAAIAIMSVHHLFQPSLTRLILVTGVTCCSVWFAGLSRDERNAIRVRFIGSVYRCSAL